MAGMPDIIAKPPFLERLDWLSRTINYSELTTIIAQLEPHLAADGFMNVAKGAGLLPNPHSLGQGRCASRIDIEKKRLAWA